MIEFHRPENDEHSDEIEERFNDMIITFKVETYDTNRRADYKLPHIKEGKTVVSGKNRIEKYLQELEAELKWQRSLSGDGCYIDPETGKVC